MLVGVTDQQLDAGHDLRQDGVDAVLLTEALTEICKRKIEGRARVLESGTMTQIHNSDFGFGWPN